jgi:hypothetical protein
MAGRNHIFPQNRSEIFFVTGLDTRISLELPHEIRFFAHGIFEASARPRRGENDDPALGRIGARRNGRGSTGFGRFSAIKHS